MKHEQLAQENCAIARTSAVVGERWVWLILRQAFNGAHRFEEFQRGIGLARNILADRMTMLIDEGILEKRLLPGSASRAEYRLTAKGRALFPAYVALMQWGNEWTGLAAPPVDLLHKPCRHRSNPVMVCDHCQEPIDARETEPVVGRGLIFTGRRPSP
jgi:DNA-binding HxlR family transcriptional regulator